MKIKKSLPRLKTLGRFGTFLWIFLAFCIVLNLAFIWHNSAQVSEDSNKKSQFITKSIVPYVTENYNDVSNGEKESIIIALNGKVRMYAHSLEFVPLGFLLALLAAVTFNLGRGRKKAAALVFIFIICMSASALCALGDEIHQIFVDGRAFELKDIACDAAGALAGCVFGIIVTVIAGLFRRDEA